MIQDEGNKRGIYDTLTDALRAQGFEVGMPAAQAAGTVARGQRTANSEQRTANSEQGAGGSGQWTGDSEQRTGGRGQRYAAWDGNVEGLDDMLGELNNRIAQSKPMTQADRDYLMRQGARARFAGSLGDMARALGNLYGTTKGAPAAQPGQPLGLKAQAEYDRLLKQREADDANYLGLLQSKARLQQQMHSNKVEADKAAEAQRQWWANYNLHKDQYNYNKDKDARDFDENKRRYDQQYDDQRADKAFEQEMARKNYGLHAASFNLQKEAHDNSNYWTVDVGNDRLRLGKDVLNSYQIAQLFESLPSQVKTDYTTMTTGGLNPRTVQLTDDMMLQAVGRYAAESPRTKVLLYQMAGRTVPGEISEQAARWRDPTTAEARMRDFLESFGISGQQQGDLIEY